MGQYYKEENQDDFSGAEKPGLFLVLDGHGQFGRDCSSFVKSKILQEIEAREKEFGENYLSDPSNMTSLFRSVDDALRLEIVQETNLEKSLKSGSTCVVVRRLPKNKLAVGWVGDSRVLIGANHGKTCIDLSYDHAPERRDETMRVEKAGGRVTQRPGECCRVGGLAMSRAFGDHFLRNIGVIADPEHNLVEVRPTDSFMVLATDGLFGCISSEQVCEIVAHCKNELKSTPGEIARLLTDLAVTVQQQQSGQYTYVDDCTVMVVFLDSNQRAKL